MLSVGHLAMALRATMAWLAGVITEAGPKAFRLLSESIVSTSENTILAAEKLKVAILGSEKAPAGTGAHTPYF